MQNSENIDEILDRLRSGETLMIDNQWRSYIRMEDDEQPMRLVMRSVYASIEDRAIEDDLQSRVKYEEQRFNSLAEALLSLMDWEWNSE